MQAQIRIAGGASLADLGVAKQARLRCADSMLTAHCVCVTVQAESACRAQEDLPPPLGFAIQCRITCEDPSRNFQPDFGRIQARTLRNWLHDRSPGACVIPVVPERTMHLKLVVSRRA